MEKNNRHFSVHIFYNAMPISVNALEETAITAPSAVLMEPETGKVLFEKNSHEIRALCFNHESNDTSACI